MARGVFDLRDTLSPALRNMLPAIDAGVDLAFDYMTPRSASYARQNAKWTDRTGNARNGLKAVHVKEPMVRHELIVFHSMPYGIWLEVRWSGRYAIIAPTLQWAAPQLSKVIAESVRRALEVLGD
jgi:hypothetical protein